MWKKEESIGGVTSRMSMRKKSRRKLLEEVDFRGGGCIDGGDCRRVGGG